jgi:hypothetical protein
MTPKEKAIKIVSKYEKSLYGYNTTDEEYVKCINCAFIAIDEIIHSINLIHEVFGTPISYNIKYWKEVKKEIKNL